MTTIIFNEETITILKNGTEELTIPLHLEAVQEGFLLSALHLAKACFNNPMMDEFIELDEDGLYMYEDATKEEEIVMWNFDEMLEDKEVVFSVFNALNIFYTEGINGLKEKLNR